MEDSFKCREKCGVCCIIPSISSFIPEMPNGKPGGVPCVHLTEDMGCSIFTSPQRPAVCKGFKAEKLVCGNSRSEASRILSQLEGVDVRLDDIN